jgi:hypothetical protein
VQEICTLRARWRGLETEPRISLHGHERGNPGHGQGMPYGPPRQSSTLPARDSEVHGQPPTPGTRWAPDELPPQPEPPVVRKR